MRILVLGGSVFLSKATAADAVARGHEVTCVTRGRSGDVPDGARHVVWDRADDVPAELASEEFDAVVDVSRIPSHVRKAVAAWPAAHWVFVSTVNVYSDNETPDPGTDGPLVEAIEEDRDLGEDPEAYGGMKVACERLVLDGAARSMVIRPGLIVGPGDPSGRYTYWPERLAEPGPVLGPGSPDDRVQIIDARDIAEWVVRSVESGQTGVFDGVGPVQPVGEVIAATAEGVGTSPDVVWTGQEFLSEHEVEPWMGDAGAAAVAAAARVRGDDDPRPRGVAPGRPRRPSRRRHRPRHPGLAAGDAGRRTHRAVARARGRGTGGLAARDRFVCG